jgi:hypothetical protein
MTPSGVTASDPVRAGAALDPGGGRGAGTEWTP